MGPVTSSQAPLDLLRCLSYLCMHVMVTQLGTEIFRGWLLAPYARATRSMESLKHVWEINTVLESQEAERLEILAPPSSYYSSTRPVFHLHEQTHLNMK